MLAGVLDSVIRRESDGDAELFARARRAGFAGVEIVLGSSVRADSLRDAAARTGLAVPSLVLSGHVEAGGIADPDAGIRRRAADEVRAAIALAGELGSDVVLVPFFLRSAIDGEDALARCAEAFAALCVEAAPAGVTLAYEGTLPAADVRRLAERIRSPAFGVYFDLANPLADGLDPATELRALGDLVRRVHFKESRIRRGDAVPGLGRVDYASCAEALAEIGYDGWLVLETPPAPPEVVARDLAFARRFFPRLEPAVSWPRFAAFSHELGAERERLAATCTALGIDTVQISRGLLDDWLADPEPLGIPVAAVGAYKNLIAPGEQERRRNLDYLTRCLELAPLLGTSVVSTHAGTRHPHEEWADSTENRGPEAWALLLEAVEELVDTAKRTGTVLALEGSVKSALRTFGQVVELLDRFPSPHLQLVCDPYNFVSRALLPAQERVAAEFLDRFEHRFALAHVKDVGPDGAEVSTPAVGAGVFAQRPYLDFLRERRPDLALVLEHLTPEQIPAAQRLVRG